MNALKISLLLTFALSLQGCTSMNAKLAKKVGCEESEAVVERQVSAPAYERYHVTCKNKVYVCQIAAFIETCHEDDGK